MSLDLLSINVNAHTEKKGNLTYLSWAWAWAEVLKFDPTATWTVHKYGAAGAEQPCMWIGETAMVHTSVVIHAQRRECLLPVMDNKNNAIKNPDARKVSDAIMRCMTKAIAMHGLGLYIYAGEDLPEGEEPEPMKPRGVVAAVQAGMPEMSSEDRMYYQELSANIEDLFTAKGGAVAFDRVIAEGLDADCTIHLWSFLGSKVRTALKAEKVARSSMAAA